MSHYDNQPVNTGTQCFVSYCQTSYEVQGQEVENNFKCNQQPFSAVDMWRISRNKKAVSIRTGIIAI
jgi:hypothetical protein